MEQSLCAGMVDPDLFFSTDKYDVLYAKEICGVCTVRDECLAYSLEHRFVFGVWGGLDERQRAKLMRSMGIAPTSRSRGVYRPPPVQVAEAATKG